MTSRQATEVTRRNNYIYKDEEKDKTRIAYFWESSKISMIYIINLTMYVHYSNPLALHFEVLVQLGMPINKLDCILYTKLRNFALLNRMIRGRFFNDQAAGDDKYLKM